MGKMRIPLGGGGEDFDSKRSRQELINLIPESNKGGEYKSVRMADGLTLYSTLTLGPVRSNIIVNGSLMYLVAGTNFVSVNKAGTETIIGAVGGTGRAQMAQNAAPAGNQIAILNGSGSGYIYTVGGALTPITDPDFFSSSSVTVLNERFWFVRDGTNEFFGSEISDGLSYNPLTFASAEESPDDAVAIVARKSALWVIGSRTMEFWQSTTDTTLPLRRVNGGTYDRGIASVDSLSETGEYFAFLADDGTVRLALDNQVRKISDLELELKIKGNGTLTSPGFNKIDDAVGFFVDGPVHKIYYLTFPDSGYTWGYDLTTGISLQRQTEGQGTWRAAESALFDNKRIIGDLQTGDLWKLDPNSITENGATLRTTISTPSISLDHDATIAFIEVDMEVATTTDPAADPKMRVSYSKDGGNKFINWGPIELGKIGAYRQRVVMRNFGRLVRHKDFILKFEVTDPVRVQYYGLYADVQAGF